MLAAHLRRGLAAGAAGGTVYGAFVGLVGTGFVAYAESFEDGGEAAVVPPDVATAGSVAAGALWGVFFGVVVFGVLYYFLEPAIPGAGDTKSYLLAAAGFVTVSGGPWLGLPPQPPGVHQSLPTDARLVWYAVLMATAATACGLSGVLYNRLSGRVGPARAVPGAVLPFALLAVPLVLMPANAVRGPVPSGLVDVYRWTTVFGQAGLWFVLASTHAWLVRRAADGSPRGRTATDPEGTTPSDP